MENQITVVNTISKEHTDLGDLFADKILKALEGKKKLSAYSVMEFMYSSTERATFEVEGLGSIDIKLDVGK